jgi:hypothetical protein
MPLVPGLQPNMRQLSQEEMDSMPIVEIAGLPANDRPETDKNGNVIRIKHADGSITVSLDGTPLDEDGNPVEKEGPKGWFDNLVDSIDDGEQTRIAQELLEGIRFDIQSRQKWINDRAEGIKLLGITLDIGKGGTADDAPVEGMSTVRHPLLLEATIRFQANARSELLPTDGPVKLRNDDNDSTTQEDRLADALQRDLNHYLTVTASEYYPDTDRMLIMLGFGGTTFKKIYFCPLRNRPVSESVDADDLIVNYSATDLYNASRITHRIFMKPSTVKRMQIVGAYKDVDLTDPLLSTPDAVRRAADAQQGITQTSLRANDRDREIYECYCELDIRGFEHKDKNGKITGLEIPYRVTIDVSSQEILSIVRNYDEDTKELPVARRNFVKYTFVPGLGFYDIGLLHILGNTTNAITAAWRMMLDAGMFANFPGFLFAKQGARQNTNLMRVPPGGGMPIDTNGQPINAMVMPLPYKEPGPATIGLVDHIAQTGQRVGGIAEMEVGEGKQNAPVGTTLALIDQATKVMNSVHKRLHAAQSEEFQLLVECFREHPESFWQFNRKPSLQWDQQRFEEALKNAELVPQADPNTASQTQRMLKIAGLKELQRSNPTLYDPIAIDTAALQAMGWSNPQQFMVPPAAMGKPPPEMLEKQEKLRIEKQKADAQTMVAEATAAEKMAGLGGAAGAPPDPIKLMELQTQHREMDIRQEDNRFDAENRQRERESRERIAAVNLAKEVAENPASLPIIERLVQPDMLQRLEENEQPLTSGGPE